MIAIVIRVLVFYLVQLKQSMQKLTVVWLNLAKINN